MTLGWKTALTPEVDEAFMRSGTLHVFAISGLHIALVAGIVGQVLRLLLVPRRTTGLLVIVICWAYTLATGGRPSAVRSTLMTTFVVGGMLLARPLRTSSTPWPPPPSPSCSGTPANSSRPASNCPSPSSPCSPCSPRPSRTIWRASLHGIPCSPNPPYPNGAAPAHRRGPSSPPTSPSPPPLGWARSPDRHPLPPDLVLRPDRQPRRRASQLHGARRQSRLFGHRHLGPWPPDLFNHASWFFMHGMLAIGRWAADLPHGCRHVTSLPPPSSHSGTCSSSPPDSAGGGCPTAAASPASPASPSPPSA